MITTKISLLGLTALLLPVGLSALPQAHSHDHAAPSAKAQPKQKPSPQGAMDAKMMMQCHEMMQKHTQMMADFKAMDEKLDRLVVAMNTTTGSEKLDAMAAVVNELVAQRKAMQEKMATMQTEMMQHMAAHMQQGGQSMAMCPMMRMMEPSAHDANMPDAHSMHHTH